MKLLNFDLIMNNIVEEKISSDYLLIARSYNVILLF